MPGEQLAVNSYQQLLQLRKPSSTQCQTLWEMGLLNTFPTSPDPVLTTPSWCLWPFSWCHRHQENGQAVPTMQGTYALLVHCMPVFILLLCFNTEYGLCRQHMYFDKTRGGSYNSKTGTPSPPVPCACADASAPPAASSLAP
jgi:hypothetical protein